MTAVAACELGLFSITTQFGKGPISIPKSAEHRRESQEDLKLNIKPSLHSIFLKTDVLLVFHLLSLV